MEGPIPTLGLTVQPRPPNPATQPRPTQAHAFATKEDPASNCQGWPYGKEAKPGNLGITRHRGLVSEVLLSLSQQAARPAGYVLSGTSRSSQIGRTMAWCL